MSDAEWSDKEERRNPQNLTFVDGRGDREI